MLGSGPNRLRPRQTTRPIHPFIKLINSRSALPPVLLPFLPDHILPHPFSLSLSLSFFLSLFLSYFPKGTHLSSHNGAPLSYECWFYVFIQWRALFGQSLSSCLVARSGPPLAVPNGACLPLPLSLQLCLDGLQRPSVNRSPSSWTPTAPVLALISSDLELWGCYPWLFKKKNIIFFHHSRAFSHSDRDWASQPATSCGWTCPISSALVCHLNAARQSSDSVESSHTVSHKSVGFECHTSRSLNALSLARHLTKCVTAYGCGMPSNERLHERLR